MIKKSLALLPALLLAALFAAPVGRAHALSGSDFKPGRIIDDVVFTNTSTMTADQIQRFLESKVANGSCDTNGSRDSTRWNSAANRYYTHAEWGQLNGNPAPFVCLTTYRENPSTKQTNLGNPTALKPGDGSLSAAEIILAAAQQYNINPQVLVVLLQKEQSLVTDDWPWNNQYQSATGAYCPDTAGCDATKAGFGIQVQEAARLFRSYMDSPFLYFIGNNTIRYNPNVSCGNSTVYIENAATEALYHYTPYQPNSAALNNLYGSGDTCSAYGNRNFWRYFNDWFGSTSGPPFYATFYSQSGYSIINGGTSKTQYIEYKNSGYAFWKDSYSTFPGYYPVHLASTSPINRPSAFQAPDWANASRPAISFNKVFESDGTTLASDQHTVYPNQIARFEFGTKANASVPDGTFREYFQPILEGSANWIMGGWAYLDIGVHVPTYRATYFSQGAYPTITQGSTVNTFIAYKNNGNEPWYKSGSVPAGAFSTTLATSWGINRASAFKANDWTSASRPATTFSTVYEGDGTTLATNQNIVLPGQIARFNFSLTAGQTQAPGYYQEHFQPILEGAPGYSWNMGGDSWLGVTVPQPVNSAVFVSQSAYPTIARGSTATAFLRFKNTGNTTWYDERSLPAGAFPIHLATSWPINRASIFSSTWPNPARPNTTLSAVYESDNTTLSVSQQKVLPNQIAEFRFTLSAPSGATPALYKEYFEPILEGAPGYTWSLGASAWLGVTVQ